MRADFFATSTSKSARLLLPLFILFAVWLAYEQGVTGSLFYDDYSNLSPLAQIDGIDAAKVFVFDGSSGPIGRPIALATFLPYVGEWPASHIDARRINVIIHLANGILLGILAYVLLRMFLRKDRLTSYYISLFAAAMWLTLPLLASTNLILIQRMTGLATFLGLLGLLTYFFGYRLLPSRPRIATLIQMGGLGLGTLLAVLAKESGILIPIFALIIEATIGSQSSINKSMRRQRLFLLYAALALVLGYLWHILPVDLNAVDQRREFSVVDRILTQSVILWQYLYLAFIPRLNAYGPYHDDVSVVDGFGSPILAISAFLFLLVGAYKIRNQHPLLLLALLWFFAGHLLESTTVMLELYFEHRNYLAVFGFCLALCYYAFSMPKRYMKLSISVLSLYIISLWAVLLLLTTVWGKPLEAAAHWHSNHPASTRAAIALGGLYYEETNGDSTLSRQILDRTVELCPECLDVRMQSLLYACGNEQKNEIGKRLEELTLASASGNFSPALLDGIYPLRDFVEEAKCLPADHSGIQKLINSIKKNPASDLGGYPVHLNYLAALNAYDLGQISLAKEYLDKSEQLTPTMLAMQLRTKIFIQENQFSEAILYLNGMMNPDHISFLTKNYWNQKINEMISDVESQMRRSE